MDAVVCLWMVIFILYIFNGIQFYTQFILYSYYNYMCIVQGFKKDRTKCRGKATVWNQYEAARYILLICCGTYYHLIVLIFYVRMV